MKIRCIAVDDEHLGRKMLEDNIGQIPFLELVKTCKNAFEAMEALETENVDLVFLDIQMPGMLGTQFIEGLTHKPIVIFVTAYDQYALESFNLEVADYLMKPVSFERFTKAALKARELYKLRYPNENSNDYMFVNVEYSLLRVNFENILYVEGLKDYIKIYLNNAVHPVVTKSTLKGIEEKLPSQNFLRVQKSFIVNINKIESIRNHRIYIGKHEIPVSDTLMDDLLKAINYNK